MYSGNARCAGTFSTHSRYRALLRHEESYNKRFGNRLAIRKSDVRDEEITEDPWALDPRKKYTKTQLEAFADNLLREDSRREMCRKCNQAGQRTGVVDQVPQRVVDDAGNVLVLEYAQFRCASDHLWWQGEGSTRGIKGDNPILFEDHMIQRRKREIYTTVGTPDPAIVSGLYNRSHPQGRKINTPEQRRAHGASYYRG
jgi:hypothetical protein